jgi:hypothetical protein
MNADGRSRGRRIAFGLISMLAVPLLVLFLVEGGSSMLLFGKDLATALRNREPPKRWTTFDPQIGAVPRPHVDISDMWGPGIYFRTNSLGFRNTHEFTLRAPADRLRAICSGDSYTMGQGVTNDDAWCARLAAIDPRLETVNMGMSGYGFDNAYLRFRYQGRPLEYDVHLFAFITEDLYRMHGEYAWFWQRTLVQVQDGRLVVPEKLDCLPCQHAWARPVIVGMGRLRIAEAVDRIGTRLGLKRPVNRDSVLANLATHMIGDLAAMARASGGRLVLVHLPTVGDYGSDRALKWRQRLRALSGHHGVPYIDLFTDFQQLPSNVLAEFFLPAHIDRGRHYTAAGHAWVADQVYRHLIEIPEVNRRVLALEPQAVETGSR